MEIKFRPVKNDESSLLLSFIKEKAEFDKTMLGFTGEIKTSEEKIIETIFCNRPYAFSIFATLNDVVVGFAIYYFKYSSFEGKSILWLEDLLIKESFRGKKIGENFMKELYRIASSHNCSHLAWTASKYNIHGIRFYERLGAKVYSKMNNSLFLKWELK